MAGGDRRRLVLGRVLERGRGVGEQRQDVQVGRGEWLGSWGGEAIKQVGDDAASAGGGRKMVSVHDTNEAKGRRLRSFASPPPAMEPITHTPARENITFTT